MSRLSEKLVFENRRGERLAGRLDRPAGEARAFALFAHCFTCSKDIPAASRISRRLAERGVAVLRFDFTGLGGSGGEFENTNFSSNVDDLVAAAEHLREHYQTPTLLIGHSLGGAAVLAAARRLPGVKAVSTIAAPSDPRHVRHLLVGDTATIEKEGVASVDIAGRTFRIQKQFLDDLDEQHLGEELGALNRALLVFHSPIDRVVGIEHAERIYKAARGFKSFVSLEDADHLLSDPEDATYVADVLTAWASRYIAVGSTETARRTEPGTVVVEEIERPFLTRVRAGSHDLLADEPTAAGGSDLGPGPYDYLLAALGTCTTMTLRMYADRKGLPVEGVTVRLRHSRIHAEDCADCETTAGKVDRIERVIDLDGDDLDDTARQRLLEIADKCPVHRTLRGEITIPTELA